MLFNDVNKYCMCVYPVKGVCNQGVALVIFYGLKIWDAIFYTMSFLYINDGEILFVWVTDRHNLYYVWKVK